MRWIANVSFPSETAWETSSKIRTFPRESISAIAILTLVAPISTTATGLAPSEGVTEEVRFKGADDMGIGLLDCETKGQIGNESMIACNSFGL